MSYNSKYTGQEVEELLDQVKNGNTGGTGGGGIASESDPIYSASPAAKITDSDISEWNNKQETITDLDVIREGASKGATALQSYTEQYKGTVTGVKMNGTTKNPSSGVVDLGTVITEHQDISGKQDKLVSGTNIKTVNGESILGEGNIVTAYPTVNHGTSDTTYTLTPNTYHVWGIVTSLNLSFGAEESGVVNEYVFQFDSGSTATTLSLPASVKWVNGTPTIDANMTYQVSIVNNIGLIVGV